MAANGSAFRDACRRQVWVVEGWFVIADAKLCAVSMLSVNCLYQAEATSAGLV